MEADELSRLEEKYWRGETSTVEEERLRSAAREHNPGLSEALRSLMMEIGAAREEKLDEDFEAKFWAAAKSSRPSQQKRVSAQAIRWAAAVVALVVLAIAAKLAMDDPPDTQPIAVSDTFEDPEIAFREATKALMFTSHKLSEGAEPLQQIKKFDQAKKTVRNTAQPHTKQLQKSSATTHEDTSHPKTNDHEND